MTKKEKVDLYAESAFKATIAVRDFLESEVVPVLHAQVKTNLFEEALGDLYFRMMLWGRTLAVLNTPDHFQAVRSGARAAFELHLDIRHLAQNPGVVDKMFAFTKVWKYSSAKKLSDFLAKHPKFDVSAYRHHKALVGDADKRKEYDELIDKYWPSGTAKKKAPLDWSGKDIYNKARDAGAEFELRYRDEYGIGSLFVHSGIVIIDDISHEALVNAYARGHLLFQESYLKATAIVCEPFRLLEAKPELRKRLQGLEYVHETILTNLLMEKDGIPPAA